MLAGQDWVIALWRLLILVYIDPTDSKEVSALHDLELSLDLF